MSDNPYQWIYDTQNCSRCDCGLENLPAMVEGSRTWRHQMDSYCTKALGRRLNRLTAEVESLRAQVAGGPPGPAQGSRAESGL